MSSRRNLLFVALPALAAVAAAGAAPSAVSSTSRASAVAADVPLVLQRDDAPGLTQSQATPAGARAAIAAVLPHAAPSPPAGRMQAARFVAPHLGLWSVAFDLRKPNAAARYLAYAAAAAAKAHTPRTRVRVGEGGWLVRRRGTELVLWRDANGLGAIVLRAPYRPAVLRQAAAGYARLADLHLAALGETAWQRTLDEIRPDGTFGKAAALDLFSIAYGALPGTKRPAGPAGPADGTTAALALLSNWKSLSAAERRGALKALGIKGFSPTGRRSPQAARTTATPPGGPGFEEDPALEQIVAGFIQFYEDRIGVTLDARPFVGTSSESTGALADALPVNALGLALPPYQYCKIRLSPLGQALPFKRKLKTLAHEAFHCMQYQIEGFLRSLTTPDWVTEGMAEWASLRAEPLTWDEYANGSWMQAYLLTCSTKPLFTRSYDAVGFWGHADESGSLWSNVPAILNTFGDEARYTVAQANVSPFLDTWAPSVAITPQFGWAWTTSDPIAPPQNANCPFTPLALPQAEVQADPYTVRVYAIDSAPPDQPLLHVQVNGPARIGNGREDSNDLRDAWFCLADSCECPPDKEGNPPPAPHLDLLALLALNGNTDGTKGTVETESLDKYCHEKQPPPRPSRAQPIKPAKKGGYARGGGSEGDPHVQTGDGAFYDFQAAGEFTLVRSTRDRFEIQVRQQPYPGNPSASVNTAIAMRVAADRVVVSQGQPLLVRVNGRGFRPETKPQKLPGGGTISTSPGGQLEVGWPDGTVARLWTDGAGVSIFVSPARARAGKLTGLLGNFDGKASNDFVTRDGKQLASSAVLDSVRLRYGVFGNSWRITQAQSLFDYAPGQSTRTFTLADFPRKPVTAQTLPAAKRAAAERACRQAGITEATILLACVLDVALTGDNRFATSAATMQRTGGKVAGPQGGPPPPVPTANDPKKLVLQKADVPAGAVFGPSFAIPGGKYQIYSETINFRAGSAEEELTSTAAVAKSSGDAESYYKGEVSGISGFPGEQPLQAPAYGDVQSADWAVVRGAGGAVRARAALVVRSGDVVWTLTVENCGTLAPAGCTLGTTPPPITKAQAFAELERYAARQKARVGKG